MSKTTNITINNLHITVGAASSGSRMSDLLGALLGSIRLVPADENGKTDESSADSEQTAAPVVDTIKGDLVAFLQPNEHFELRTLAAIQKKFNTRTLVELTTALRELLEDSVLYTKRRRADGETLYGAIAQAYVDVPARPEADADTKNETSELTVDTLVGFLKGGDYELRSFDAICNHFGASDDVTAVLQIAVGSGKVYTRTRRSDGATLYGAA